MTPGKDWILVFEFMGDITIPKIWKHMNCNSSAYRTEDDCQIW